MNFKAHLKTIGFFLLLTTIMILAFLWPMEFAAIIAIIGLVISYYIAYCNFKDK